MIDPAPEEINGYPPIKSAHQMHPSNPPQGVFNAFSFLTGNRHLYLIFHQQQTAIFLEVTLDKIGNPKQDQQEQLMKLELVKAIDPLHASGTDLHDIIMRCTRTAIGEKSDFFDRNPGKTEQ